MTVDHGFRDRLGHIGNQQAQQAPAETGIAGIRAKPEQAWPGIERLAQEALTPDRVKACGESVGNRGLAIDRRNTGQQPALLVAAEKGDRRVRAPVHR
ncbi:MAG: hypothetical protein ACK4ZN_14520, partial [Oceanibaculum sp.]